MHAPLGNAADQIVLIGARNDASGGSTGAQLTGANHPFCMSHMERLMCV